MTTHRNYDPGLVIVNFKGVDIGAIEDINAERAEDLFKLEPGAQGDTTYVRSRNRTGSVQITIHQSAPSNDYLSSIMAEDELFGNGTGPLFIKDLNGTTLVEDQNARLMKFPAVKRGKDLNNTDWMFGCPNMTTFIGGSVS
jgi:hypothetical protein